MTVLGAVLAFVVGAVLGLLLGRAIARRPADAEQPALSPPGRGLAPVRASYAEETAGAVRGLLERRRESVDDATKEDLEELLASTAANAWSEGLADLAGAVTDHAGLPDGLGEKVAREALRHVERARGLVP